VNKTPGTLTATNLGGLEVVTVEEASAFLNILIYGPSGTGKTTLAGSADKVGLLSEVLFIDIEGGTQSLVHSYPNVKKVRVSTWPQMQEVYHALFYEQHGYRTVVLDSLTEIQRFNMDYVMQKASQERDKVDVDVPAQRDWGVSSNQVKRMIRGFRDLPMNTIFTALSKEERDPKTGQAYIKPDLPGKLAGQVPGFLDIVSYYYLKEVPVVEGQEDTRMARILLSQATEKVTAKDRSGKLPQVLYDPTMAMLFDIMYDDAGKADLAHTVTETHETEPTQEVNEVQEPEINAAEMVAN
jgi:hypothetical protein